METNEHLICTNCKLKLPETRQHTTSHYIDAKSRFAGKVPIQFVASYLYFSKRGIVQQLIHAIKYKGQKEAAKEIAYWYGCQLKTEREITHQSDFIIGVPLHSSRFQQRGYNQADWIAEGLSEALDIPTRNDVLMRRQFKESQTRKTRMERWENVKTVFTVEKPEAIKGKNIVLVDDVLTTGATIEACAIELLRAGCKSVGVLTLAVTK